MLMMNTTIITEGILAMAENPITELLKEKNLSQSRLALMLGVTTSNVSNLVNGRLRSISNDIARRIEELFNIPAPQVQAKYRAWREEQEQEARRSLTGGG